MTAPQIQIAGLFHGVYVSVQALLPADQPTWTSICLRVMLDTTVWVCVSVSVCVCVCVSPVTDVGLGVAN